MMNRLAIVLSHPIQYYVPWFQMLAEEPNLDVRVFFLWSAGTDGINDRDFEKKISWDLDLLDGYPWQVISNNSGDPGTHHYGGLDNPAIVEALLDYMPDVILMFGYKYKSHQRILRSSKLASVPKLFRGDSHVIVPRRGPKEWIKSLVLRLMFKRFSGFLAVGGANIHYLKKYGVHEERIFFAPHSVDNERFISEQEDARSAATSFRIQLDIPQGALVFLFAGKFNTKKRPLDLLHAFLQAEPNEAHLVFVGSGELEDELLSAASGTANVHFLPFKNQSEMPSVYALGDILVLPSFGSGETWGLCVNEAFCMRRPAIVSDHVGCQKDLVEDGVTGKVFPADDVGSLSDCLSYCASNPEEVKRWGLNAYQRVQKYSYTQTTEGLMKALDRVKNTR